MARRGISIGFVLVTIAVVVIFFQFVFVPLGIVNPLSLSGAHGAAVKNMRSSLAALKVTDPALKACIGETALPLPEKDIGDVAMITSLNCNGKGIATLNGIDGMRGLTSLQLAQNTIADPTPLATLPGLKALDLSANRISDISVFYRMQKLETLALQGNPLTDITPLGALTSLRELNLAKDPGYRCDDLRYLSSLSHLKDHPALQPTSCDEPDFGREGPATFVDCTDTTRASTQRVCNDPRLLTLDRRLHDLYGRALVASRAPDKVKREHLNWQTLRDNCYSTNCALDAYYNELDYLDDVLRMRQVCKADGLPLISYRTVWAARVKYGEPEQVFRRLNSPGQVFFHSEVLGAEGRNLFHRWYRNGQMVFEQPFQPTGAKARLWSSYEIPDPAPNWEARVVDESGCVIKSVVLPSGDDTVFLPASSDQDSSAMRDAKKHVEQAVHTGQQFLHDRDIWGDTRLLVAIRHGDGPGVEKLLKDGASPWVWDAEAKSALQLAKEGHNPLVIGPLEQYMAHNPPPWSVASLVLTNRVESGAPQGYITTVNQSTEPVYAVATIADCEGCKVTHRWLRNGKEMHVESFPVKSSLSPTVSGFLVQEEDPYWSVEILINDRHQETLKFRADLSGKATTGASPRPVNKPYDHVIRQLVKAWAPPKKLEWFLNSYGPISLDHDRDLLESSVETGNIGLVRLLAARGLSPAAWEGVGGPMVEAAKIGRMPVISYLLAMGVSPDVRDYPTGQTALHNVNGRVALANRLLDYGANPNRTDNSGNTPLHAAAYDCDRATATVLLNNGVDREIRNAHGKSAFEYARGNCSSHPFWKDLTVKQPAAFMGGE